MSIDVRSADKHVRKIVSLRFLVDKKRDMVQLWYLLQPKHQKPNLTRICAKGSSSKPPIPRGDDSPIAPHPDLALAPQTIRVHLISLLNFKLRFRRI